MSGEEIPGDLDRVETAAEFFRALRALRERSGLTIRQVAQQAKGPVATIGDYFSGRHLPTDRDLLTRVLAACGETDPNRARQWHLALGRARRMPGKRGGPAPYRGLARFEDSDARWFFGREDDTRRLAEAATAESALPLVLIGPSGAGKSSLLRAGLLPYLDAHAWAVTVADLPATGVRELTDLAGKLRAEAAPGTADTATAHATMTAAPTANRTRRALVVDQAEAVFTLCDDEDERHALISALCDLAEHALVVLALRADFYGQAIRYPGLRQALQERHVVLGPMTASQVRSAVVQPARLARADVDERLIRLLLADLAPAQRQGVQVQGIQRQDVQGSGDAAYDQGALPLLSHAMLATWNRSKGGTLTVGDYLDAGGIRDALNQTAEHAYESLTEDQRAIARRLFLHLVHVSGDHVPGGTLSGGTVSGGTAPSRASVPLGDLPGWGQAGDAEQVLSVFVGERMITVDTDSAQITHDALLTAWPRLRTWIDESTGELRDRGRILEGARAWDEAQREDAALWRGSRLGLAREWAEDSEGRSALSALALEFVDACVAAGTASDRAARRRTRWLQSAIGVLTVLVLAIASLSGYAFSQRAAADTAASQANSRDLAFTADQLRATDPAAAAQLSVSANEFARTPQSTASLLESSAAPSVARIDDTPGIVQWVTVSPDEKLLAAVGNDGSLRLWNVARPGHPVLVSDLVGAGGGTLYGAGFSPDGKLLAVAGANRTVTVWRLSPSGRATRAGTLTGPASAVYAVAFSPDSGTLAAASTDGTVRLWDVAAPGHFAVDGAPLVMRTGGTYPDSLAFSPSGSELVVGTSAGTVWLWHLPGTAAPAAGAARPTALPGMPLRGPANSVSGIAFSPSGDEIAAASKDFKVWLWRVSGARAVPDGTLTGSVNWANTVAFSPSGDEIAAGTSSSNVLVWNLATHQLVATLPHPQPVTSVAWNGPDRIAAGSADGTVSLWALPTPVLATGGPPTTIAYSPDGSALAVGASSIELWDTARRTLLASRALPAHVYTNATVFRPSVSGGSGSGGSDGTGSGGSGSDGTSSDGSGSVGTAGGPLLAVALSTGTVELLNGTTLAPVGAPFSVITGTGTAESVAFSPSGKLLATGADDGSVRLYDVTDPAHPRLVQVTHIPGPVNSVYTVVFSPDGTTLAAASLNNVVQLYRVTGGASSGAPAGARLSVAGPALGGMASYPVGLAFTPNGATLAVANADKHVYLFGVADPARPRLLGAPLAGPSGNVWAVSVSPDGTTLAASSNDGTVWLWNIADPSAPTLTATLSGLPGHVFSVVFSPNGRQLAAASYDDDTVRLWDTSPAAAKAAICSNLGQPLSEADWASDVPGVPYRAPCSA
ncbi:MAG TPA: helix-turn-helix domain-containing protein [Trebonia sp.]